MINKQYTTKGAYYALAILIAGN